MELTTTQKRQRLLTMIFGAVAIFFTGYPHVWSIYQPYVMEQAGWSQTAASMCFYLALSTFVFGNIIGEVVCKIFRINEPIAKGLALGTSAHAIGTAKAMEMGEVEGAMSSLSVAVAGLLTVIVASVFSGLI